MSEPSDPSVFNFQHHIATICLLVQVHVLGPALILVNSVAVGRAGLGSHTRGRERRQLIQDGIGAEVEEERRSRTLVMHQQGAWTNWDHASSRNITWTELWKSEPARFKFLIQAVYDVLPSPSNLHCWGLMAKYLELVEACRANGWRARCEPIEVGCRFPGQSLHRALRLLDIRGLLERKATRNIVYLFFITSHIVFLPSH